MKLTSLASLLLTLLLFTCVLMGAAFAEPADGPGTGQSGDTAGLALSYEVVSGLQADEGLSCAFTVALSRDGEPLTEVPGGLFADSAEAEATPITVFPATFILTGGRGVVLTGLPAGVSYTLSGGLDDETYLTEAEGEREGLLKAGETAQINLTTLRRTTGVTIDTSLTSTIPEDADKTFEATLSLFEGENELTALPLLAVTAAADGEETALEAAGLPLTLALASGQTLSVSGLPIGVRYQVAFAEEKDYAVTVEGETEGLLNAETAPALSLSASRRETWTRVALTWADGEDADGLRPSHVTATLKNNMLLPEQTVTLSARNSWSARLGSLPATVDGAEVVYTWSLSGLPEGYSASSEDENAAERGTDGTESAITLAYEPAKTEMSVAAIWRDSGDNDALRPETLSVTLLSDGSPVYVNGAKVTALLSEDNSWQAVAKELPKYGSGKLVNYSWAADVTPPGYELLGAHTFGGQTTLSFQHLVERVTATVRLIWDDADNREGLRPQSLKVTLVTNKIAGKSYELNEANGWTATVGNLRRFHGGDPVTYSWFEDGTLPVGYTMTASETAEGVTVLTNSRISGSLSVTQSGVSSAVPFTVTLSVPVNGAYGDMVFEGGVAAFTLASGKVTARDLPVGASYTVKQTLQGHYAGQATGTSGVIEQDAEAEAVFTVSKENVEVQVSKLWEDDNNRDKLRPGFVSVHLKADGVPVQTAYITEEMGWVYTFTGLDKTREDGTEIAYTVSEDPVPGYTTGIYRNTVVQDGVAVDGGWLIRNHHAIDTVTVNGVKRWIDQDNKDGMQPDHVTVHLLADGTTVDTKVVTAETDWVFTFTGLPKLNGEGKEIDYTVTEEPVEGYTGTVTKTEEGLWVLENAHTEELTEVHVTKRWTDGNNLDGVRPGSVTVRLLANGVPTGLSQTLDGSNNWNAVFMYLPAYENGEKIVYTVMEDSVTGYTTWYEGNADTGITVVNRHQPAPTPTPVPTVTPTAKPTATPAVPRTGDDAPLGLWLSLMLCSMILLAGAGVMTVKRKQR
ncbi:MAG: Cna B-type domain-containing protein [Clostridia bacterium]|nr:Cna B-type domain-containing protein [Clostridia bacterium]